MDEREKITNYIEQLEADLQAKDTDNKKMYAQQNSLFSVPSEDNLIRWQLDLKEDMDRIHHLLKGDIIIEDKEGTHYDTPVDPRLKLFNDFGVQLLMNIMSFYLNRNTLLSNYDEKTIQWKVLDFGYEVSDLILVRYEEMFYTPTTKEATQLINQRITELRESGVTDIDIFKQLFNMDIDPNNPYIDPDEFSFRYRKEIGNIKKEILFQKIKMYPMVVAELVDTVHSAYLRALDGGERESLRTARTVTQTDRPIAGGMNMNSFNKPQGFSLLHPIQSLRGK